MKILKIGKKKNKVKGENKRFTTEFTENTGEKFIKEMEKKGGI